MTEAQNAAEAGSTVAVIAIVATATAQQNNQQDNDKESYSSLNLSGKVRFHQFACVS